MSGDASSERRAGDKGERIAKRIARSGFCSRRDAERLIAESRVKLNGRVLTTPAVTVGPSDKIEIDGEPLAATERTRLFLFNKPKGLVTTNRDPQGRPTVFSILPAEFPRVVTIGRLDINTEGLLLLTNDGGLARVLELPATGWLRRYRVRAHGTIDQPTLDKLRRGITIDGMVYGAVEAKIDRVQGTNLWLTVGLREGKNREVKRVLEHLGLGVNRLIRVSYGPFQLGELKPGEVEEVRGRVLRDQLGEKLASAAGADFAAPIRPIAMKKDDTAPPSKRPKRDAGRRRAF
jgi:23S rRNA pseudouridine2605 synthase